jgi:Ser/Thr protein kinase RdoA (MazF antagonist)
MGDTLLLATDIARRACKQWDCITSLPTLFMHRENSVFKVQTSRGSCALRVHRHGYHDRSAIESELMWMAHLAGNGLQVPQPLANVDGALIGEVVTDSKIFFVDVLTWLDGVPLGNSVDPLGFDKEQLQAIFHDLGHTIARMHGISDRWVVPQAFKRHAWDRDGFVGETPFWGAFWNVSGLTPFERQTLLLAREKAARELDLLFASGADYGLIHADFVRQNILVQGTGTRIIDFDDSGFGFRMYDFATALVKNREEPHYEAMKQALFQGYRSCRPLSEFDERTLGLFLTLRDFAYLGWLDARRGEPGVGERLAGVRRYTLEVARQFLETAPIQGLMK